METVRLFVGYDPREAAAYHVFCQSVIEHASLPVSFTPLQRQALEGFDGQRDGSNAFIYSRFLVPLLCDFNGWAIFCDGDMVCLDDIGSLWNERERFAMDTAVAVVKHDYQTKNPRKYLGTRMECANESYPRKNWSSVILWNCGHFANQRLTKDYIAGSSGAHLHRFAWLADSQIGELEHGWNHLIGEDPPGRASLYHYTLGVPGIAHYGACYGSWRWHSSLMRALECGDAHEPKRMVARAEEWVGTPNWPKAKAS